MAFRRNTNWIIWGAGSALAALLIRAIDKGLLYFNISASNHFLNVLGIILIVLSILMLVLGWYQKLSIRGWGGNYDKPYSAELNGSKSFKAPTILTILALLFIVLPFPNFSSGKSTSKTGNAKEIKQVKNNLHCEVPAQSIAGELNGDKMKTRGMHLLHKDSTHTRSNSEDKK